MTTAPLLTGCSCTRVQLPPRRWHRGTARARSSLSLRRYKPRSGRRVSSSLVAPRDAAEPMVQQPELDLMSPTMGGASMQQSINALRGTITMQREMVQRLREHIVVRGTL